MSKKQKNQQGGYKCQQCGKPMNVIDYLVGVVCLECCKKNHRKALGK